MSEEIKAKIYNYVKDSHERFITSNDSWEKTTRDNIEFGYRLAQEEQPSQDELWEEFWRNCVESDRGQEYFNYEEAKKRYRITRVK